jgi:hypothetical protein
MRKTFYELANSFGVLTFFVFSAIFVEEGEGNGI